MSSGSLSEIALDLAELGPSVRSPTTVAVGENAVWVIVRGGATQNAQLLRIDPATSLVVESIRVLDFTAMLAVGEGSIWATDFYGWVLRIDPQTGVTLAVIVLDLRSVSGIAAGAGAVWIVDPDSDSVVRIDPQTNTVTGRTRVGRSPEHIATGAGAAWVTSERDGTVTRIDPVTSDLETIDVGGIPTDVAVGLGGVWVTVDAQ